MHSPKPYSACFRFGVAERKSREFPTNCCLALLKSQSQLQIAHFQIWTSVQIAVIAFSVDTQSSVHWVSMQSLSHVVLSVSDRWWSAINDPNHNLLSQPNRTIWSTLGFGHLCHMLLPSFAHSGMEAKWPNCYSTSLAPHCRSTLCRIMFSRIWKGCPKRMALHTSWKSPVAPTCSILKVVCRASSCLLEGVAVQGGVAATLSPVALQWLSVGVRGPLHARYGQRSKPGPPYPGPGGIRPRSLHLFLFFLSFSLYLCFVLFGLLLTLAFSLSLSLYPSLSLSISVCLSLSSSLYFSLPLSLSLSIFSSLRLFQT